MRRSYRLVAPFLPCVIAALIATPAFSAPAIYKIKTHTSCASAFSIDASTLVTNLHAIDGACDAESCSGISIEDSEGQVLPNSKSAVWQVFKRLSGLDLIALRADGVAFPSSFELAEKPLDIGGAVRILGFSGCQAPSMRTGKVTRATILHNYVSAKGGRGISGSPVLNSEGKIVGVVDEVGSPIDGLINSVTSIELPLRTINSRILRSMIELAPADLALIELKEINAYYTHDVLPFAGLDRLWMGFDFMALVENFSAAPLPAQYATLFGTLGRYPAVAIKSWPKYDGTEYFMQATLLVSAYNLELKGPFDSLGKATHLSEFENTLHARLEFPLDQARQVGALLSDAQRSGYPGVELYLVRTVSRWVLIIAAVMLLLGLSLGWMYARLQGSILRRFLITISWGLLVWPISVIIFAFTRKDAPKN